MNPFPFYLQHFFRAISRWFLFSCRLSVYLCLCLGASYGQAQASVRGKVIGRADGRPVPGATVFINNSTYQQICDAAGNFELTSFPAPPYELIITAVGYKTGQRLVTAGDSLSLTILLEPKPVDLKEVLVMSAEKDGWQKYGRQFTEDFIGYSPFAAQCKILNREVLQFRYDKNSNMLKVWADKPLLIRNEATGYLVTYWLEDYQKEYSTKKLYFKGYTQFADLETKKKHKVKTWQEHRRSAYNGSLSHFMRSLYRGTVAGEGFEIRSLKRISGDDYGKYVPLWTDTLGLHDSVGLKALLGKVYTDSLAAEQIAAACRALMAWADTGTTAIRLNAPSADEPSRKEYRFSKQAEKMIIQYFDLDRPTPQESMAASAGMKITDNDGKPVKIPRTRQTFDVVDPRPLTADSFLSHRSTVSVQFLFPQYLLVTYTRELEEEAYLARLHLSGKPVAGNQASIISLSEEISVYPDGNFSPSYNLMLEAYWAYEKLDKLLPLDYRP